MGVFVYANHSLPMSKIENVLKSRGHKNVSNLSNDSETLIYAGKILENNVNFLSGSQLDSKEPTDFIIGVGTYFYDGAFGADALKSIYRDVEKILTDNLIYGHYGFVVRKNSTVYVFNDLSGVLRLYYAYQGERIVVSSSLLSVIASLDNPKFDKVRLAGVLTGKYGKELPFVEGVESFDSRKYLELNDKAKATWKKKTIPESPRVESLNDAVELVKKAFKEQTDQLKALGDEEISLELSAGLDSRLMSSVMKTAGFNYSFIHFPLYGPDKEVAFLVANGLHKEIYLQPNTKVFDDAEAHFGEFDFGFNFFSHYANPRRQIKNRFQFTGGRGECLDLPDIYSDEDITAMKTPVISSLIPILTVGESKRLLKGNKQKEFVDYMIAYFEKLGFDTNKTMTEYEQQLFGQELGGITGDYRTLSAYAAHNNRYSIFNESHFNREIANIAFDVKSGRKLTLALISSIDPELGSYPFVSRLRTRRPSVNETKELPAQYKHYGKWKEMAPRCIVDLYYRYKGQAFDKKYMDKIDFSYYEDIINVSEIKRYPALYKKNLERLYSVDVVRKALGIQ